MSARAKPVSVYRRRLKRRGVVRVEVHVRKDDAALIRGVARALDDPERADQARALLRARFTADKAKGLKALLAAAPLEGIDLTRARDTGRQVDLWAVGCSCSTPTSEVRKGAATAGSLTGTPRSRTPISILSVLVLGEIRRGVELARRNDSAKADALGKWLQLVEETFDPSHIVRRRRRGGRMGTNERDAAAGGD